jgi:hypothetical protein
LPSQAELLHAERKRLNYMMNSRQFLDGYTSVDQILARMQEINREEDALIVQRWVSHEELPAGTWVRNRTLETQIKGVLTGKRLGHWHYYTDQQGQNLSAMRQHDMDFLVGGVWYNHKGEKLDA